MITLSITRHYQHDPRNKSSISGAMDGKTIAYLEEHSRMKSETNERRAVTFKNEVGNASGGLTPTSKI
jgi:hypothetical protein